VINLDVDESVEELETTATREDIEKDLAFSTTIVPPSEYHSESERRANAKSRIEDAWGETWGGGYGEILPPWPAELVRELARFGEE